MKRVSNDQKQVEVFRSRGMLTGEVMKFSRSKMSFAALAIVLVAGIAIAQPHSGPHGGGDFFGGPMLGFFTDYLDLTEAQQAQIKQIIAKEKPALEPLFKQEMQSHEQMMQLIRTAVLIRAKGKESQPRGRRSTRNLRCSTPASPLRRTRFLPRIRKPSWLSS